MPIVAALRPFVIEGVTYARNDIVNFADARVSDYLIGRKDVAGDDVTIAAATAAGGASKTHAAVVRRISAGDGPVFDRTDTTPVVVDPQTGEVVGGGGGGGGMFGPRKTRLARAMHYAQHDAIDPLAHEIMRAPADWTASRRFTIGSSCKNPSAPGYYFMFRGLRPAFSGEPRVDTGGGFTTVPAPVPDTRNPYGFVADLVTGATWYQYPSNDFPVTKKSSLLNSAGTAPITPITALDGTSFPTMAGVAMTERYRDSMLRTDQNPVAIVNNNYVAFFNRVYDPARKTGRNQYGYGDLFDFFDASGVAQTSSARQEFTFDVNCSALGLEFSVSRNTAGAQAGDVYPFARIFVDGVSVDWLLTQFGAYSGSGGIGPKIVLPFRDNRRRRIKVVLADPLGSTISLRTINCSNDGTILPLPFRPSPWYFSADSTGAGASPGPQDFVNVGRALGWTIGFGQGMDISKSGTGHLHPVDGPSRSMNHATKFIRNADAGYFDATAGGEDFLMHVIYVEGWDEITTDALFTPEYRRAKYTEFLNRWKAAQPNCVLVLVAKRIEAEAREHSQFVVANIAGIAVGDTLANAASNPTVSCVVRGFNTASRTVFVDYSGTVNNDSSGTVNGALNAAYSAPIFGNGNTVFKAGTALTTVTNVIANRVPAIDSTGEYVPLPSVYRDAEALVWADWLAAIEAAGLSQDQYMFVTLADMELASDFKNSWRWYSRIYQDLNTNNLAQSYDLVHPSQQYHAYVGRYIGQQIRRALTVDV